MKQEEIQQLADEHAGYLKNMLDEKSRHIEWEVNGETNHLDIQLIATGKTTVNGVEIKSEHILPSRAFYRLALDPDRYREEMFLFCDYCITWHGKKVFLLHKQPLVKVGGGVDF